jgi:hypothetical protein
MLRTSTPTRASALGLVAALTLCLACRGESPSATSEAPRSAAPGPTDPTPSQAPAAAAPSGDVREETVDGLKMLVPVEWVRVPVRSSMRVAEFALAGPGGDVQLVVYRFPGGAGSAADNIERWKTQMEATSDPLTSELEAHTLKVTAVDLRGRFAGQSMPGAPAQPPIDDARMLAAAIEGPGDPYYFKIVGAAATVDLWATAWTDLLSQLAPVENR